MVCGMVIARPSCPLIPASARPIAGAPLAELREVMTRRALVPILCAGMFMGCASLRRRDRGPEVVLDRYLAPVSSAVMAKVPSCQTDKSCLEQRSASASAATDATTEGSPAGEASPSAEAIPPADAPAGMGAVSA